MKPKTNEQLCVLAQRGDAQAQEQLVQNNQRYIPNEPNQNKKLHKPILKKHYLHQLQQYSQIMISYIHDGIHIL